MSSLTEIETAADALPVEQKEELTTMIAEDEADGACFRQGR